MKADPARQQRLLDLQALDTRLARLQHRLRTLPEHAELSALTQQLDDCRGELVRVRTAYGDVQRELTKAEVDVQLVRDRAARNRQRLETGTGTAKDLQGLQHELESLARRQGALEDVEIEVMERAEALDGELAATQERESELTVHITAVTGTRDDRSAELQAEHDQVAQGRDQLVTEVGADLVALYDKVREHSGTGAAGLVARRCTGCQLELTAVDLGRFRSVAPDEVMRCEECRRILVRTDESGL